MSHCVFRCVENRLPAVRVTNSGSTCVITPDGRIYHGERNTDGVRLRAGAAPLRVEGVFTADVAVPLESRPTVYTRFGDILFAIPCAAASLSALLLAWRRREA